MSLTYVNQQEQTIQVELFCIDELDSEILEEYEDQDNTSSEYGIHIEGYDKAHPDTDPVWFIHLEFTVSMEDESIIYSKASCKHIDQGELDLVIKAGLERLIVGHIRGSVMRNKRKIIMHTLQTLCK
jgi:hypothetical protein